MWGGGEDSEYGHRGDSARAIAAGPLGGVLVTGAFLGTVNFNPWGLPDIHTAQHDWWNEWGDSMFVTQFKGDGTYGWTRSFDSPGGRGIAVDGVGNVLATGGEDLQEPWPFPNDSFAKKLYCDYPVDDLDGDYLVDEVRRIEESGK